jgi:hypothetical protein
MNVWRTVHGFVGWPTDLQFEEWSGICRKGEALSPRTYLLTYLPTYLLLYLLTPWSRVLLEKLTGLQLVKKFPTFYGTQIFITAFISVCHLSLS